MSADVLVFLCQRNWPVEREKVRKSLSLSFHGVIRMWWERRFQRNAGSRLFVMNSDVILSVAGCTCSLGGAVFHHIMYRAIEGKAFRDDVFLCGFK